ncbi:MAG: hypothetical protein OIF32_02195 [Campylobacterales bacterium]|nr:hypothetical protein [Campylobacterales bacterium]
MEFTILVSLIVLLGGIITYLLFFYNKREKTQPQTVKINTDFYDWQEEKKSDKVDVFLVLKGKEYIFSHKKDRGKEIRNIGEMIGKSIDLMKESKYDDIMDSRKREILAQFKKLTSISTFTPEQFSEVERVIKSFQR